MNFLTDLLTEHTNEIISTIEDKEFIFITELNLPDKFFTIFLERQGLRLKDAENIKFSSKKLMENQDLIKHVWKNFLTILRMMIFDLY